jgi:very-long-chain enoyl-CoA reductase
MKISVATRSSRSLGEYQLHAGATTSDLNTAIHAAHPKFYPDRQRLYRPASAAGARPVALKHDGALVDGEGLVFKDLGPQILWKTVFLVEYLGPLLIYPLFFSQPAWIYGKDVVNTAQTAWAEEVQFSALVAWTIHYAKRELETLLIHRFSHATMPVGNLFKNCAYYWGFAAFVSYFVNHPLYTPPPEDLVYIGMVMFYFMEVGNLSCHVALRGLRPAGTRIRAIPTGGLFDYVTCPNYTYEILAWVGFNLMTRTVAGVLFMCAGAFQMFVWATGKHRNYKKEFNGKDGKDCYPLNRKIIIPFIY